AYFTTIESKISFTSDLWMSPNNKAFISVTAHYVDENWALKETVVDFGLINGRHTGINIANGFFKVLNDYGIMMKLLAITLDNTTNNDAFIYKLETKLQEEELEWNSEHHRFHCFNHILNLVAQAALNQIDNNALNMLTSTHSIFHHYAISHIQWEVLEKIAKFLELFKDLTTKMSSNSYCTAFWIIPLFNIILDHIEDVESNTEIETPLSATTMAAREKLVRYYSKTNATVMLCMALDLRQKFHYFFKKEFSNDEINETKAFSNTSSTNANIKPTMRSLLDTDFDEDKKLNELECYILEKPASKEVDVLAWWK
ncbi:37709_t:CDS:2, partial [Gigaspora margarita]